MVKKERHTRHKKERTFVPTTRFLTPSMYFDPVLMMCENMVLIEEVEATLVRDWARGLAAILVKALRKGGGGEGIIHATL